MLKRGRVTELLSYRVSELQSQCVVVRDGDRGFVHIYSGTLQLLVLCNYLTDKVYLFEH